MNERELVPISPIGEELYRRFQQFSYRTNPHESPMALALTAYGYKVTTYPTEPAYTTTDWLASQVCMAGVKISFRQPTPNDLWVSFVERENPVRSMTSALFGVLDFFAFCHDHCPEMDYVGGQINKHLITRELTMDQLIGFYNRFLGGVECYEKNETFSIYAKVHAQERYDAFPIWKWRKERNKRSAVRSAQVSQQNSSARCQ